jgi:hypothetical protein
LRFRDQAGLDEDVEDVVFVLGQAGGVVKG